MNERLFQAIWRAQAFDRQNLRTTSGDKVEIVYRGRPQRSPGPDFRGAAVAINGAPFHGDIELHLRSIDWRTHRHNRDRRYNGVVLHVVLDDCGESCVQRADGNLVPNLVIGQAIAENYRLDNPTIYPLLDELAEPSFCASRLERLSDDEIGRKLDRFGILRLEEHADRLEAELAVKLPETVLFERLLEALGYSQNRKPGLRLAEILPYEAIKAATRRQSIAGRIITIQALLFQFAGLLPESRRLISTFDPPTESYLDDLSSANLAYGRDLGESWLAPEEWCLAVRPLNSPLRRLGALGDYLGHWLDDGPVAALLGALSSEARPSRERQNARSLVAHFTVNGEGSYWGGYFDFGRPLGMDSAALVGESRAREIAINLAIPFLLALDRTTPDAVTAESAGLALEAYGAMPRLGPNEVTSWMIANVITPARARVVSTARRQQGIHYLYDTACDQAACDSCPLFA